jgi:lipopolysaccharide biosynthesis glycosyltransferase
MPAVTYARLLIGDLLPASCRRVLWLDSDVVLIRDVGDLWRADTNGAVMCAVQDLVVPYADSSLGIQRHSTLGVSPDAPYFNAGVMLIDLSAWRAHHVGDRALTYLRTHWRHVTLWDQEGLNVALDGAWRPLDARWNVIASVAGRSFFEAHHLDARAYAAAVDDPWIVHFAGTWKPWLLSASNRYRELYFSRLAETAFAGTQSAAGVMAPLMRVYDSRIRDHAYGLERWWLRWVQMASRARA